MRRAKMELRKGTLDVLILKTLSWGPAHGYAVSRWIRHVTEDVLLIEEGALYPSLHRMEAKGWIESEWGLSENNRKAKYYGLTKAGRQHLQSKSESWTLFAEAVSKVLNSTQRPSWAAQP